MLLLRVGTGCSPTADRCLWRSCVPRVNESQQLCGFAITKSACNFKMQYMKDMRALNYENG